jgi:hypothetical protein
MHDMNEHPMDSSAAPDVPHAKPLPREWLPEGAAPDGDAVWEERAARILARTELAWEHREAPRTPWLTDLGRWLSPAAALAASAAALLLAAGNRAVYDRTTPDADAVALSLITADGDPVALWATIGVTADPVLALLTLEDHTVWTARADPATPAGGVGR